MKIAITGGSGFIGTQLCTLLKNAGHEILIIDIAPSAAFPNERHDIDVRDLSALTDALKGCDAIYHLAAEHRDDVQPIQKYYDVNVEGGKNVIKAAETNNIGQIIFTSTVAVYGLDAGESQETQDPAPFNDYGRSKLESEKTFENWVLADKTRTLTTLRLVATFGPKNRGNIFNLMNQIASGKFIMIGNGRNHKSIAYVENVAAFLVHCLDLKAGHHLYNYADKPDLNMHEFVTTVRTALGRRGIGFSLPYTCGILGGLFFDILAKITGRTFPISRIRVKKFCADTVVNTDKLDNVGFEKPYVLEDGLKKTIHAEFKA